MQKKFISNAKRLKQKTVSKKLIQFLPVVRLNFPLFNRQKIFKYVFDSFAFYKHYLLPGIVLLMFKYGYEI